MELDQPPTRCVTTVVTINVTTCAVETRARQFIDETESQRFQFAARNLFGISHDDESDDMSSTTANSSFRNTHTKSFQIRDITPQAVDRAWNTGPDININICSIELK